MKSKFTYLEEFINRIDVICPTCKSKAVVISNPENRQETRFTCINCGSAKDWAGNPDIYYSANNQNEFKGILIGKAVDCYFKLPLWYKTEVKGEILFAYNLEHLIFLNNYISDKLRERKPDKYGWSNRSIESRLPKQLLSAKNKSIIKKKIKELMNKNTG